MEHKLNMNLQNSSESRGATLGCANETTAGKSVEVMCHEDCLLPKLYEGPR